MPLWLADAVGPRALQVALVLMGLADWHTGQVEVARKKLAERARCSLRSIDGGLAELEAAGFLSREARPSRLGQGPNRYTLHPDRVPSLHAETAPEEATSCYPPPSNELPPPPSNELRTKDSDVELLSDVESKPTSPPAPRARYDVVVDDRQPRGGSGFDEEEFIGANVNGQTSGFDDDDFDDELDQLVDVFVEQLEAVVASSTGDPSIARRLVALIDEDTPAVRRLVAKARPKLAAGWTPDALAWELVYLDDFPEPLRNPAALLAARVDDLPTTPEPPSTPTTTTSPPAHLAEPSSPAATVADPDPDPDPDLLPLSMTENANRALGLRLALGPCEECGGNGWREVVAGPGATTAVRCDCGGRS